MGEEELKSACLEMARITKWARKPFDAADIAALADRFYEVAKDQLSPELEIYLPLITRAVRCLGQVHAIPPMGDDTGWLYNMLRAVLEVATPNIGVSDENKQFLRDVRDGIDEVLSG